MQHCLWQAQVTNLIWYKKRAILDLTNIQADRTTLNERPSITCQIKQKHTAAKCFKVHDYAIASASCAIGLSINVCCAARRSRW